VAEVMSRGEAAVRLRHLRRFAHWLDDAIKLPGIPVRVGLDSIIGLVPGLGDAAGAILGAWILVEAARLRASRATLVRIVYNIAVDALGGTIPLLGDAFDVFWKANLRNVAFLERHLADPARAAKADRRFVALLCGVVLALCGGLTAAGVFLVAALIRFAAGH
jgi:hypothetical protein